MGMWKTLEAKQTIFGKVEKTGGEHSLEKWKPRFFVHRFFFVGYLYGGGWVSTTPPHKGEDDAPCCPTVYPNQKKKN